jgi:poly(3-hydroxybutyrate) depolymerase
MMTRVRAALVLVVMATASVAAEPPKPPCPRCTLDVPAKHDAPVPLLVVLHGDRDHAANAAKRWRAAAKARGWALLSLECPKEEGCPGSWWKWNGDPAWLLAQVAAVQSSLEIDPARIYLAGWSGGATYIGMHAPAWPEVFAGVVIHGGGHAPSAECPARALPAYFLVGNANPLHHGAVDLRGWFDGCAYDVTWDLVKRGDHDKEERALTKAKAIAILDWLAARPRT